MTPAYCTRCDKDTAPTVSGDCSECGHRMPWARMTEAQVTAGAEALLARHAQLEAAANARQREAQQLTKRQLKMLNTVDRHGRVLGAWNDKDLGQLRLAGFVRAEELRNATGKASSSYLWMLTTAGARFLETEGLSR